VKRKERAKRSQLLVNQQLCVNETWDEQQIDVRGAELASLVVKSWPGPQAEEWNGTPS
jgi:hypothetical protein